MNYHNITVDDMLNGDGLRVVLWTAGCSHRCEGCHNPVTWDAKGGLAFDQEARAEITEALAKPYISGLTFSGGDPLYPDHIGEVTELAKECKEQFPDKTIWLYTGYLWEEVCDLLVMDYVDVLVDGPYVKALFDPKLHWKGSGNQRVIDVKKSKETGNVIIKEGEEHERD